MISTCFLSISSAFGRLSSICLVAGVLALVPVSAPRAACTAAIVKDVSGAITGNTLNIQLLTANVGQAFGSVIEALTLWANQETNNTQRKSNMDTIASDREAAQTSATAVAANRVENVVEFTPSEVVCQSATAQARIAETQINLETSRTTSQELFTDRSTNVHADTREGTLSALYNLYEGRCGRYANDAAMQATPTSPCPSHANPDMVDRDIQPFKAILDPIILTTDGDDYHQAALDAINMLTEPAPTDRLAGPALTRSSGKSLFMLKMRDVTRMNLARGVLEDMVAMRFSPGGAGGDQSRMSRYVELVTGESIDYSSGSAVLSEVVSPALSSKEAENAAVQTFSSRLATQQALLYEIMRVTEQMLMVDAVNLAIRVEQSGAGNAGLSARPTQN